MGRACSTPQRETRNTHKIWLENLKISLGGHRSRWKDNIRMYLREIGCEDVEWIQEDQDRDQWRVLVNTVMNLRVPRKVGNFLTE
jgi:hypothetical protein